MFLLFQNSGKKNNNKKWSKCGVKMSRYDGDFPLENDDTECSEEELGYENSGDSDNSSSVEENSQALADALASIKSNLSQFNDLTEADRMSDNFLIDNFYKV